MSASSVSLAHPASETVGTPPPTTTLVVRLVPDEELETIIPLLQVLNPTLGDSLLRQRLGEMRGEGYKCVGVYDEGQLVGCSGLWITTRIYVGRFVEPDNVVVHPEYRSEGVGKLLLDWMWEYAKQQGCVASELNCYVTNSKAQKFWMNSGHQIIGFRFQKHLHPEN